MELMVSGAAPVLAMWRVCVEDWPITAVLKLKLVAEREIEGALVDERGATVAQPATAKAITSKEATTATLPIDRQLEWRENTPIANLLRFGNFKLLFEEE
jgi:hypothetical protein